MLLSISGGSDLGLFEINEAAQLVADAAHPDANIIFGAVIDDALGDEVRVTVIAAGFDAGAPSPTTRFESRRSLAPEPESVETARAAGEPDLGRTQPETRPREARQEPRYAPPASAPSERPRRTVVFEDDLDVPDFLK